MSRMLRTRVAVGLVMASFTLLNAGMPGYILPAYGQTQPELKNISPQFVTEPGCPIEVIQANTQLEMDPFGTPMAARHYIDYRNSSGQPVAAVKFRIGYVADDGKIHQPYLNAPDAHPLNPGEQASQKWRGDRVDPRTQVVKIRVLMVKMADGSIWESQKSKESALNAPAQEGFVPLQTEVPGGNGGDIASGDVPHVPGTPVPLTDTAKSYGGYPQQTQSGTVPFKPVATPAPGFDPNAFNAGGVPSATTGTTAGQGFAPFSGANAPPAAPGTSGLAGVGTAGAAATGAAGFGATTAPSGGFDGGFGTAAPAVAPTATAPITPTPAAIAPAPSLPSAPKGDPTTSLDALLGNPATPGTPAPAPVTPTPAPVAPAATPDATPPAVAPSVAPAAAMPDVAPAVAPAQAAPPTAPPAQSGPGDVAPAQAAPAESGADSFSGN